MKFKLLIIFLFTISCSVQTNSSFKKSSYTSSGFAYVYNDSDFSNKIVSKKFDNMELLLGHNRLRAGTIVKISNPENKKSTTLKIKKKVNYPDFYTILITDSVLQKLELSAETPYVEIQEIKKNKSFVAGKSNTFNEERKVSNKAPVMNVKIDNISKNKNSKKVKKKIFSIVVAEFYSIESARNLKKKLNDVTFNSTNKKLLIKKKKKNSFELILGPYKAVNSLKNDYIALKDYGFEDLEITINE
tara:strand:- start:388 stop:1122 length:735 start_codon:yes stop_codon:yes gene_type:complete